jgi:ATP-dependent DNA helicase PIF1
MSYITLNAEFLGIIDKLENTTEHIFITGSAGTGKSSLLGHFKEHTNKTIAVLAPTGIAAINVKGQTIHSFFKLRANFLGSLKDCYFLSKKQKLIYQKLDLIVIDEISMVRADLFDCVDLILRKSRCNLEPFGGVQMILIGDLYQLPPVVTRDERKIFNSYYKSPYFFSSKVFKEIKLEIIELIKVYRQKDLEYVNLLNDIRKNCLREEGLRFINKRYIKDFKANQQDLYVYLAVTNKQVMEINYRELQTLKTPEFEFVAQIEGEFSQEYYPTLELLKLKVGAQIMMIRNDPKGRWVNGSLGKVKKFLELEKSKPIIVVELEDGMICNLEPYTWSITKLILEEGELINEQVGSFTQYPLILAWAITIHKSQGKTFSKAIIDLKGAFAHGQSYARL